MRYRRNESFRYKFEEPIYCFIEMDNKNSDGQILDLSPKGLKLVSAIDVPLSSIMNITFGLNGNPIKVNGVVRWKKSYSRTTIAGIQLLDDQSSRIVNELKQYVKKIRNTVTKKMVYR